MKFFDFKSIKSAGDCAEFAKAKFGATVKGGRCNAAWRGGDGITNVSIDKEQWYDHVQERGGGIIELAAHLFNGDTQQTQEFLGEYYNLTPKMQTGPQPPKDSRYDSLIRQGYQEVKRYGYHDIEGVLIHFVSRLEHPTLKKQFCQGRPDGWGLNGTKPILYNLAAISESDWCCIVEGEKNADILIENGVPATTCCGGAKKWKKEYSETLRGKSVAILPDNDAPGREHGQIIATSLIGIAKDIIIVETSMAEKGDVYDYLTTEGHDIGELYTLMADADPLAPASANDAMISAASLKTAKTFNTVPFRNFIPVKRESDGKKKRRRTQGDDVDKRPRLIQEMIDDCHRRFVGFPRKVGEELFDHDRDSQLIVNIYKASELFAWIGRKSKQRVEWTRGDAYVTKDELLSGLSAAGIKYEAISHVPDWPKRSDVYYAHDPIPPPCPQRSRFEHLVSSFAVASDADKTFLRAFLIAPLWYIYGIPKPSWIIDSEDGAGTGKSTIAEIVAYLYKGEPVRTNRQELRMGIQELIKRLISSHGRQQRIVLVDNVVGQFSCPELADLITGQSISGRAPYGRGEETRPNNCVFVITANTATVDNDIADRSYYINVRRPPRDPVWKSDILAYIDKNRFEIVADIISILDTPDRFRSAPHTRFPEFETQILQAVCSDQAEYDAAIDHISTARADTNAEDEQAQTIDDTIRERLCALGIHPDHETVFIKTKVMELWMGDVLDRASYSGHLSQHVRNLAKMQLLPMIDSKTKRWPNNGESRRSGFMWNRNAESMTKILTLKGKNEVEMTL